MPASRCRRYRVVARQGSALRFFVLVAFLAALAAPPEKVIAADPSDAPVDFLKDIQPILKKSCVACHGAQKRSGGLRLHRRRDALAGGDRGVAIMPGKSADSLLVKFITGQNDEKITMPPPGDYQRLTEAQVRLVKKWIDEGAAWPDSAEIPGDQ